MENQQPRLPWFRLATMARQETETDAPPQPLLPPPRVTPPLAPTPQVTPSIPLPRVTLPLAPTPQTVNPTVPLPRVTPPLAPIPQPVNPTVPLPRVTPPLATTPQPVNPTVQQDVPKDLQTTNGSLRPVSSPPPSPKVIKSSSPTPPPSPKVINGGNKNNTMTNPEPEIFKFDRLKSIAMQDIGDKKDTGSNYNNYNNNYYSSKNSNSVNMREIPPSPERKEKGKMNESRVNHPPLTHKKNEKDTKVITIAGENIGAFMELGNSHGYNRKIPHGFGHTLNNESKTPQEKAIDNDKNNKDLRTKPIKSLVNSNVQSINNSLMFNSSCSERSPGVHITLKSKSKGKGKNLNRSLSTSPIKEN